MSDQSQNCPKCQSPYGYPDGNLMVCPECFHEWPAEAQSGQVATTDNSSNDSTDSPKFLDANGTPLVNGDTVATVKDLKLGKDTLKSGTKVKGIRLLEDPVDDHDISCKIPGHGSIYLKCSVVKKLKG